MRQILKETGDATSIVRIRCFLFLGIKPFLKNKTKNITSEIENLNNNRGIGLYVVTSDFKTGNVMPAKIAEKMIEI